MSASIQCVIAGSRLLSVGNKVEQKRSQSLLLKVINFLDIGDEQWLSGRSRLLCMCGDLLYGEETSHSLCLLDDLVFEYGFFLILPPSALRISVAILDFVVIYSIINM